MAFLFQRGRPREAVTAAFTFQRGKHHGFLPVSCRAIYSSTSLPRQLFKQRTCQAMSPAPNSPLGVSSSCTRLGFGPSFHSSGSKGLGSGSGRRAGRCSGSGRSCPGEPAPRWRRSRGPSAGGTASPPLPLLTRLEGFHLSCGGASRPAGTSLTVDGCGNLQAPGRAP